MKLKNYSNYEFFPESGKIYSLITNKFVGKGKSFKGYNTVILYDDEGNHKQFYVHRLIWEVVNGEIPKGLTINHLDEDKQNNSISNLSLCTYAENNNWGTHNRRVAISNGIPVVASQDGEPKLVLLTLRDANKYGWERKSVKRWCDGSKGYSKSKKLKWQYMDAYLADWLEKYQDMTS